MKKWFQTVTLMVLVASLLLLCPLTAAHAQESAFFTMTSRTLNAAAQELGLKYEVKQDAGDDRDSWFSEIYFDLDQGRVIAFDQTFGGELAGLSQMENIKLVYLFTRDFEKYESAALEQSSALYYFFVIGPEDEQVIGADNHEQLLGVFKQMLLKLGMEENDPFFQEERADESPNAPLKGILSEFTSDASAPTPASAEAGSYPKAADGLRWRDYTLAVTECAVMTEEEHEKYQEMLEYENMQYVRIAFSCANQEIPKTEVADYARLIQLVDEQGRLLSYDLRVTYSEELPSGRSSDEYMTRFALVYALPAEVSLEELALFVPGVARENLYALNGAPQIPDRYVQWEGQTLWVADYNDGDSMDEEDRADLEEGEQFLELRYYTAEGPISGDASVQPLRLQDAQGNTYNIRKRIVYQFDSVAKGETQEELAFTAVYFVPEGSRLEDFSIVVDDSSAAPLPVVPNGR